MHCLLLGTAGGHLTGLELEPWREALPSSASTASSFEASAWREQLVAFRQATVLGRQLARKSRLWVLGFSTVLCLLPAPMPAHT